MLVLLGRIVPVPARARRDPLAPAAPEGPLVPEIVISGVETILFDVLIGAIGWRFLLKPYIEQRQRRAVEEDHALHGIDRHD